MPELPEVETTVKYLKDRWLNKAIKEVVIKPRGERHFNTDVSTAVGKLTNSTLLDISRIGKWMLFSFHDSNQTLLNAVGHLRMSGRYLHSAKPNTNPHLSFQLKLNDGSYVSYLDQRRFGTFHFAVDFAHYPSLQNLGPDVFASEFTADYLYLKLTKQNRPIYQALLDQSVVAGLGNIYVNEALHASNIHPLSRASALSYEQILILRQEIKRILTLALELKGTTLIDNLYYTPGGETGAFYDMLKVYGKKKHPLIQVFKIGGRSAFVHKDTTLQT